MVILQTIFCPTDLQFLAPTSLGSFTNMMLLPFIRYLSVVALKEMINLPQSAECQKLYVNLALIGFNEIYE